MTRPIVMVELNEVTNLVLDRYIALRPTSALAHLLGNGWRATTRLPHEGLLEPWVVWPSIHRGVPVQTHGIVALGQPSEEADRQWPPVWDLLIRNGKKVGVFSSLHVRRSSPDSDAYAFLIPDFFSDATHVIPDALRGFHAFNGRMTRESKHNVSRKLPLSEFITMALGLRALGLTTGTMLRAGRLLLEEVVAPHRRIRRRAVQAAIVGDIFSKLVDDTEPDLSTIFINSVATALHRYWAAAFPGDYVTLPLSAEFGQRYRNEITYAFDALDPLFSRLRSWAERRDGIVVIASGFGQAPVPTAHTFTFVTLNDVPRFLSVCGIEPDQARISPTMTPYFSIALPPDAARRFREVIPTIRLCGARFHMGDDVIWPLSAAEPSPEFFSLYVQFDDYTGTPEITIGDRRISFKEAGFGVARHEDGIQYSAYHTNEGSLLWFDPGKSGQVRSEPISALAIASGLLSHFGCELPGYMTREDGPWAQA
jgi:hypothetical protein